METENRHKGDSYQFKSGLFWEELFADKRLGFSALIDELHKHGDRWKGGRVCFAIGYTNGVYI